MKKQSAIIIAVCDLESSPGVFYKYDGISKSSNNKIDIVFRSHKFSSKWHYLSLIYDSIFLREDVVMYRSNLQFTGLLCVAFLILKIKGKKVICEVPTPFYSHLKTSRKVLDRVWYFLTAPLLFMLSTKVLCYAKEGGYLKVFDSRMQLVGNGIVVNDLSLKACDNVIRDTLNIVGVATIAIWHGWDQVLYAISKIPSDLKKGLVFHVVGDGPEKEKLVALSSNLGITQNVIFYGMLPREKIIEIYDISQLAVGTLNWKGISVKEASPLKYREYSSVGLPFLYSTYDPDYVNTDVAILIDDGNVANSLEENIIKIIDKNLLPSPTQCRQYAVENLDYSRKIIEIFS